MTDRGGERVTMTSAVGSARTWWVLPLALLGVSTFVLVLILPGPIKRWGLRRRLARSQGPSRFKALYLLGGGLEEGMGKHEVERLLGRPDNTDCEYVWMWGSAKPRARSGWRHLFRREDCVYLLFDANGVLASGWFVKDYTPPLTSYKEMVPRRASAKVVRSLSMTDANRPGE